MYLKVTMLFFVQANLKNIKYAFEMNTLHLLQLDGVETIFSKPGNPSEWRSVSLEFLKKMFGLSKSTFTCIAYGALKKASRFIPKRDFEKAMRINKDLKKEFTVIFYTLHICHYKNKYIKNSFFSGYASRQRCILISILYQKCIFSLRLHYSPFRFHISLNVQ